MRKKKVIISILILLLAAGALPYAVGLDFIEQPLKKKIQQVLPPQLRFGDLSWGWFPAPSLYFHHLRVAREELEITASRGAIRFFPAGLWRPGPSVEFLLERPDIGIKWQGDRPAPAAGKRADNTGQVLGRMPSLPVRIEQARIRLPSTGYFSSLSAGGEPVVIDGLDARLVAFNNQAELSFSTPLPGVESLRAKISVKKENTDDQQRAPEPYWEIRASAQELDLSRIRQIALGMLGDHEAARRVCGIIRGGRARAATYEFTGRTADLKQLAAMTITADVEEAAVTIPEIELPVQVAAGDVAITAGKLTCRAVSGHSGDVRFENGELGLDLNGRPRHIDLQLEAAADPAVVPDWLSSYLLKKQAALVTELNAITGIAGRIRARVEMAGELGGRPLPVTVAVHDSRIRAESPRLHHPAELQSGVFTFAPDSVRWRRVSGSLGPNRILDASGNVAWGESIHLAVDELTADLDAAALLAELRDWPVIREKLPDLIRSATGPVSVRGLQLDADLSKPAEVTYNLAVSTEDLRLDTPLLPEPVLIRSGSARLGSGPVMARDCSLDMAGDDLHIMVDMPRIARLDDARGWLESQGEVVVSGVMRGNVARWLAAKQWIPAAYFPRSPCRFDPLTVRFTPDGFGVDGALLFNGPDLSAVSVMINSTISDNAVDIEKMDISAPTEKADLRFRWTPLPDPNIDIEFSGQLSEATADRILASNELVRGTLSGDCRLKYFPDKPAENRWKGSLCAEGINIFTPENVFSIHQAHLAGGRSYVDISRAALVFNGESFDVTGRFALGGSGEAATRLKVSSRQASLDNLQRMVDMFSGAEAENQTSAPAASKSHRLLSGHIDFDFERFVYHPDNARTDVLPEECVWQDLAGMVRMSREEGSAVVIHNGSLCGISTTGVLRRPPERSSLRISAGAADETNLEDVLTCLGIKEKKITGRFTLEAELTGTPDNWQEGTVRLVSRKGEMQRLTFLSKLFSILNVTDILSLRSIRNMFSTGYAYSEMQLVGTIDDNRLLLADSFVKGAGLDFFFNGSVALDSGQLDLLMFVKPFSTIDAIITTIPLVGKDVGAGQQSIAFIPLNVGGTLDDPRFYLLPDKKQ